jgi:hypothetical protein
LARHIARSAEAIFGGSPRLDFAIRKERGRSIKQRCTSNKDQTTKREQTNKHRCAERFNYLNVVSCDKNNVLMKRAHTRVLSRMGSNPSQGGAVPMAQAIPTLHSHNPSIHVATGAACWVSYLINGDASGLTDEERQLADDWCDRELGANDAIVDCSEPYFTNHYDLYTGDRRYRGGDVVDYRVLSA